MMFSSTPTPSPDFDPNTVTPGWVGFAVTAIVAIATILILLDMVRRIRRMRYQAEIRERLAEESAAAEQSSDD